MTRGTHLEEEECRRAQVMEVAHVVDVVGARKESEELDAQDGVPVNERVQGTGDGFAGTGGGSAENERRRGEAVGRL